MAENREVHFHGVRIFLFLGILLGSFLIFDMMHQSNGGILTNVWGIPSVRPAGPAPLGPIEPTDPEGDALCPDVHNSASATDTSTVGCGELYVALAQTAAQSCVSGLGICQSATVPPHPELCQEHGVDSSLSLDCQKETGWFWDTYTVTATVTCTRNCSI